ncbi:MAG: glycosyltransferase family 4 protein [Bryobacteraceae bacterium]
MKIGIDAHGVGGHSLGAGNETYFGNLIAALLELDRKHEYHIFVNHPEAMENAVRGHANAKLVSLKPRTQWIQRPISLPLYARRAQLDLVHTPFVRPFFTGAKTVITVHDANYELFPDDFTVLERWRMKTLVPPSCRCADKIFTVSEFTKRELIAMYDIPEEKITVTYNAADHLDAVSPVVGHSGVRTFDLPKPFVFFLGTIQPKKNLIRLVEAFDDVKSRTDLPHHLVVAGPWGWRNAELNHTLDRLNHRDKVHFIGHLHPGEVRSLMPQSDLFVFPSLYESFGIPPMEAQRLGVPALVSNTTCFPEIYGDSVAYCNPSSVPDISEQMEHLLRDSRLRGDIAARGRARVRQYSWRATAQVVLSAYNQLLGVPSNLEEIALRN